MATVNVWAHFEVRDANGVVHSGGRKTSESPRTITAASGVIHDQTHSVANNTSFEVYDVLDDLVTSTDGFEFMWLESDQKIMVQTVIDDGNNNGEVYWVKHLEANIPMIYGNDDGLSSAGASVDGFNGTADVVERINVRNTSGSTAMVRVFAIT